MALNLPSCSEPFRFDMAKPIFKFALLGILVEIIVRTLFYLTITTASAYWPLVPLTILNVATFIILGGLSFQQKSNSKGFLPICCYLFSIGFLILLGARLYSCFFFNYISDQPIDVRLADLLTSQTGLPQVELERIARNFRLLHTSYAFIPVKLSFSLIPLIVYTGVVSLYFHCRFTNENPFVQKSREDS